MAIETRTRIWNGLAVYESINTSTGSISLYGSASARSTAISGGTDAVLASSTPSSANTGRDWTIDDATTFRRLYNNRRGAGRGAQLAPSTFNNLFHNSGTTLFNSDRTDILNTQSATARNYYANTLGIPGITNSINQVVSPSGTLSTQAPVATQQPGTLTDGSINLNEVTGTATQATGSGAGAILRYPEMNLGPLGYDYIQIRAYDFVGAMSLQGSGTATGNARFKKQVPHNNPITIQLPMQPNISEANATDWAQDTMNAMQMAAGQAALTTINDAASAAGLATGVGAATLGGAVGAAGALAAKAGFEVAKEAAKFINSENVAGAAAYFAGQAVGSNILGRTTGQVINPNMELTFNGPKMRTFNFGFRLTPRTPSEARIIRSMIKFFTQYMAPEKTATPLF